MTTRHPSKLIEGALPLAAMNEAGRAEKAVPRKGLPATMHIWWSRKPTGLARAVLFASLVDDPADRPDLWPVETDRLDERRRLLDLVADLARWDCGPDRIEEARGIVARQCGPQPPRVVDPFCGGGAIALEASRLGLDVTAGDLNPLAAMLTRGLIEVPPAVAPFGPVHPAAEPTGGGPPGLAEDVDRFGRDLLREVRARIGHHYPPVPVPREANRRGDRAGGDGSPTVAPDAGRGDTALSPVVSYLWTRTATCANRRCRAELPLLSTWALSRRPTNRWHLEPALPPSVDRGSAGKVGLTVRRGPPPTDRPDLKVGKGANYRCLFCDGLTDADHLRAQSNRGELGLRLVAVQTLAEPDRPRNQAGRAWADPSPEQVAAADADPAGGPAFPLPDLGLPLVTGNLGAFGVRTLADLLTARQQLLMTTMCEALTEQRPLIEKAAADAGTTPGRDDLPLVAGGRGPRAYADAVTTYLALAVSRMANRVSTMTVHNRHNGSVEQSFVQPGYAFYGEFPEANPFSGSTGSFDNALRHVVAAVAALPGPRPGTTATVACAPASDLLERQGADGGRTVICTDPPYYDMFDYAALSNFFYPWLRHTLHDVWPDDTGWSLAPDGEQIVSNPARFDGDGRRAHDHFATRLRETLLRARAVQADDYPLTLYYGYLESRRQANGRGAPAWEALLEALVAGGFQITSTWPLRTERPEGVKTGSNALASSMVLSCRPRRDPSSSTSRAAFLAELRAAVREAVTDLQASRLAPVDLPQSVIGPGMAVYSSYLRVDEPDGRPMAVATALDLIHETLEEATAARLTDLDRPTLWAQRWFEEHGTDAGPGDEAELLARRLGVSVAELGGAGLVVPTGEGVRLRHRSEIASVEGTDGDGDLPPVTTWATFLRLLHAVEQGLKPTSGGPPAGGAPEALGPVPVLAYHHFLVCRRQRWSRDAALCNRLIRALAVAAGSGDVASVP